MSNNWRTYLGAEAGQDIVAALVITILLIPQSLAYAQLAGLPPETGIFASILPLVAYAILGRSSVLAVGPVAIVSLMTAAALESAGIEGVVLQVLGAGVLAALIGIVLMAAGFLRLGFLANYLSQPVVHGFILSSSIIILISQLRHVLGLHISTREPLEQIEALAQSLDLIHWATALIGVATLLMLIYLPKLIGAGLPKHLQNGLAGTLLPRVTPLIAILVTSIAAWALRGQPIADGIALTGQVNMALPSLPSPEGALSLVNSLWGSALLIALIAFTESHAVAKSFAAKKRQHVEPNRELVAIGAANLASAVSGGFPVAGGFARTAVSFSAGAATRVAGALTAGFIALSLVFLTDLYAFIPKATLSVIIIFSISKMIHFTEIKPLWAYSRLDATAYGLTGLGVFFLGVEFGLMMGVLLSIAVFLGRAGRPHIAEVGRIPGTEHFRNRLRHRVVLSDSLLMIRIDANLYFANAQFLEAALMKRAIEHPEVKDVVLIASAINEIDWSALEALGRVNSELKIMGVCFHLAEVKGPVMDRLERSDFLESLTGKVFLSTSDAEKILGPNGKGAVASEADGGGI